MTGLHSAGTEGGVLASTVGALVVRSFPAKVLILGPCSTLRGSASPSRAHTVPRVSTGVQCPPKSIYIRRSPDDRWSAGSPTPILSCSEPGQEASTATEGCVALGRLWSLGHSIFLLIKREVQPLRSLRSCWVTPPLRSLHSLPPPDPAPTPCPSSSQTVLILTRHLLRGLPLRSIPHLCHPPLSIPPSDWGSTVCTHACFSSPLLPTACHRASLQSSAPLPAEPGQKLVLPPEHYKVYADNSPSPQESSPEHPVS